MNTMKKRILSSVLAVAAAASMAVPAFAAGNETEITGTYEEVEIKVLVPATATAKINPYALDIELEDTSKTKISGQQIVTDPAAIVNQSSMNLGVSASVLGTIKTGSDLKFATASTKGSGTEGSDDYVAPATTKSAFVYLQMKTADGLANSDIDTTKNEVKVDSLAPKVAAWNDAFDAEKDIVVGTKSASKENMVTLKPATGGTSKNEVVDGGIAMFRLSGDCVTAPKTDWVETDGFTVNVAFTFAPVAATPAP